MFFMRSSQAFGTLLVCLVHDGTQSWGNESGGVSIGESDDGDILWNAQALGLDGVEGSVGDDVVEGEDGIRAMLALQSRRVALRATSKSILSHTTRSRSIGIRFSLKRLQVAMLATAHHVRWFRTADEGDAACVLSHQVLGSLLGCHITIAYHLRELVLQAATGKKDQWHTHLVQLFEMGIIDGILCQAGDNTFHVHIEKVIKCFLLSHVVFSDYWR